MAESLSSVKARIDSTKKTSQITKAMYMVSSSKVRKSQKAFEGYQDYINKIEDIVVTTLNSCDQDYKHPLFEKREVKTTAYLLISSDTGLAGPYHSNVFKYLEQIIDKYDAKLNGKEKNNLISCKDACDAKQCFIKTSV